MGSEACRSQTGVNGSSHRIARGRENYPLVAAVEGPGGRRPSTRVTASSNAGARYSLKTLSIGVVSKVMGHANVAITLAVYTHLFNPDEADGAFRVAMAGAMA